MLARRLIANLRAGRGAGAPIEAGADLDGLLADGYRALPADAQALVLALALADEAGGASELGELGEGAAAASAAARGGGVAGAVGRRRGRLPSAAHRRAALAAADPACEHASRRGRWRVLRRR